MYQVSGEFFARDMLSHGDRNVDAVAEFCRLRSESQRMRRRRCSCKVSRYGRQMDVSGTLFFVTDDWVTFRRNLEGFLLHKNINTKGLIQSEIDSVPPFCASRPLETNCETLYGKSPIESINVKSSS